MLWLLLALGSAFFLGGYEVTRKSAVHDNAVLPVLLTASLGGLGLLAVALPLAALLPDGGAALGLDVVSLSGRQHLAVFFKAALVTASWVLAYFAVKHLPISIAGPLRATSPVLTVLGALLLFHEAPSQTQWAGIVVIFSGYVGFAWLGRAEGISFVANRWIALLVLGTSIGAMSGLYDKFLLQGVKLPPTTLQLWFSIYNVALQSVLLWLLWWRDRAHKPFRLSLRVPLVGVLLVLADQLYFRALAQDGALVSVVSLVRRTSVVISFTLGGLLFRESLLKQKAIFLAVILAGLALLFA